MPPSPDASSRTAPHRQRHHPALLAAGLALLALTWVGVQLWPQMAMAPSALPPSLAVDGDEGAERSPLTTDTPTELRLRNAGPEWKDLTPTQRQILQPLHLQWPAMGGLTKRRWLLLAERYPEMSEKEQAKLHERMQSWASLSAQQRNQARLNFSNVKRLTPEELAAKWAEYQALSQAEKQRLEEQARAAQKAAQAARKKRKLTRVPAAARAPSAANPPKILPTEVMPPLQVPQLSDQAIPAPVAPPTPATAQPRPLPPVNEAAPLPVQVPQQMYIMDLPPWLPVRQRPHSQRQITSLPPKLHPPHPPRKRSPRSSPSQQPPAPRATAALWTRPPTCRPHRPRLHLRPLRRTPSSTPSYRQRHNPRRAGVIFLPLFCLIVTA